jgi:hypothetical protein
MILLEKLSHCVVENVGGNVFGNILQDTFFRNQIELNVKIPHNEWGGGSLQYLARSL